MLVAGSYDSWDRRRSIQRHTPHPAPSVFKIFLTFLSILQQIVLWLQLR